MPKSSKRTRPTKSTKKSSKISKTEVGEEKKVVFSFARLYPSSKKFCYGECKASYFTTLLRRLKTVSQMTRKEMTGGGVKKKTGLRCHRIDFSDRKISEPSFELGADADEDAWQFQLTKSRHGRVHGFFVENEFRIVWLDPEHKLYPEKKLEHR